MKNRMKRARSICAVIGCLALSCLFGCANNEKSLDDNQAKDQMLTPDSIKDVPVDDDNLPHMEDVDSADSMELYQTISLEEDFSVKSETTVVIYEIPRAQREVPEDMSYGMTDAIVTDQGVYYVIEYMRDMAQFASGYDVGYWNPDTKEHILLYSCGIGTERKNVNWINEFSGNEHYLVWMEQCLSETDSCWEMRCMDLNTHTVETIHSIAWDKGFELCPSVNEKYVAWYEPVEDTDEMGIFLYSFSDKKTRRIAQDLEVILEHPYSRVYMTEDTCTYAAKNLGVRQIVEENLETVERKAYFVPDQSMSILMPASNEKVILWREEYDTDWGIYIYHKEKEQLYYFPEPEGGTIFSDYLADNTLYIHVQEANMGSRILTVNLESLDIQVLIEAEKDKDFLLITNSGKYCSVYTYMDINKNNYVYVWE